MEHADQTYIDRDAYEPAYVQLVRMLRARIAAGEFHPSGRLPSEARLCESYQVSPMTVRRAVNLLLDQGLVSTVQGSGTFVKKMELGAATFGLEAFKALVQDPDLARVKLLEARMVSADERAARKLGVRVAARVIYLRRLLFRAGEPVLYHREHMVYDPTRPIVEAEMEATSLQGLLAGSGETDLKGGVLTIEATVLRDDEAVLLGGTVGDPAFRLAHTFHDFDDRPVSWGWFICGGDRLRLRACVGAWSEA
ncbi:MAG: GntR family transcriptional regulator [Deferrisomatales bacterium]|nr:GntR family transcriptional regulator [Deferrisomatales bacterium]